MLVRKRIFVRGIVQGIGFRPYIYHLATEHGLAGMVGNNSEGAFVEVEGNREAVLAFEAQMRMAPPPHARFDSFVTTEVPVQGADRFVITGSEAQAALSTPVSPDLAICDECLAELRDPTNRRFGYPFVNCTHCGPRFTIVQDIPYDRPLTTMRVFAMCAACEQEYLDPANRRFHAQPNACWDCGPTVWLRGPGPEMPEEIASFPQGSDAIRKARAALAAGKIVAVKGIGGFHLACDATNHEALQRLRERKGRVEKPFALMVASLEIARQMVEICPEEERLLSGRERPILLLERRRDPTMALSPLVAPGNDFLGLMLPYTPLHHLLLAEVPLVMTSANRSDEPIVRTNAEALERLTDLADVFLMHNREIHVVCDDSVIRRHRDAELPVRRSRGYAPLPVLLGAKGRSVLAAGGELKATFCLTRDEYAFLSQHIGDLGTIETQEAYERAVHHFLTLFRGKPECVVCDLHPGYASAQWAKRFADAQGLPLLKVQHHEAHVAALLAEHGLGDQEPLLGVAFDGTGYGHDGAVWGGEFLLWEGAGFRRVAHLDCVPLPGGDAAIRHPWRVAVSHLLRAGMDAEGWLPEEQKRALPLLRAQIGRNLNCVPTSSMGRLFDAVASVLGVRHSVSYEAQAAIELEALSRGVTPDRAYQFGFLDEDPVRIVAGPVWHEILEDLRMGVAPARISARFHGGVAEMVREICRRVREATGVAHIGLTGGVFQNVLLLEHCRGALEADGFRVYAHRVVPPNDGGLALGQAWLGRR